MSDSSFRWVSSRAMYMSAMIMISDFNIHEKLRKDFDIIKTKYDRETADLKKRLDMGRREYESVFRDEVDEIGENHRQEKERIMRDHKHDKVRFSNVFEHIY